MALLTMNTAATVDTAEILFLERRCIMTAMVITQRKRKGTRSHVTPTGLPTNSSVKNALANRLFATPTSTL